MIKAIGEKDGILGITQFPEYCSAEHQRALEEKARSIDLKALGFRSGGPAMPAIATLKRGCGADMHAKDTVMMTVATIVEHAAMWRTDRRCSRLRPGGIRANAHKVV